MVLAVWGIYPMTMNSVVSRYEELPQEFDMKYGVKDAILEVERKTVDSSLIEKESVFLKLSIRLRTSSK